tara:strand:- start:1006 stop:1377 length:372 start_codon:yes stop_codon:yes gene_type:complete
MQYLEKMMDLPDPDPVAKSVCARLHQIINVEGQPIACAEARQLRKRRPDLFAITNQGTPSPLSIRRTRDVHDHPGLFAADYADLWRCSTHAAKAVLTNLTKKGLLKDSGEGYRKPRRYWPPDD